MLRALAALGVVLGGAPAWFLVLPTCLGSSCHKNEAMTERYLGIATGASSAAVQRFSELLGGTEQGHITVHAEPRLVRAEKRLQPSAAPSRAGQGLRQVPNETYVHEPVGIGRFGGGIVSPRPCSWLIWRTSDLRRCRSGQATGRIER